MALQVSDIILDGVTSDPTSPVDGEMWFRSDTNEWRFRKNGQTKKLASRGASTSEEDVAQCKCDATTAPVGTNDSSEGYAVGSHWIDITADKAYICVDDTATSAIWIEVTQTGGGGSSTSHDRQMAVGTTLVTKTSSTYSDISDMTLTTGDLGGTGTYIVTFNCDAFTTNRGSINDFVLNVGGVDQVNSTRRFTQGRDEEDTFNSMNISYMLTGIASGTIIKVRFKRNTGTLTVDTRSLIIDGVLDTNVI